MTSQKSLPRNKNQLCCCNPECSKSLHPIGNVAYGNSRLTRHLRRYTLITLPLQWLLGSFLVHSLINLPFVLFGPIFIIYLLTTCFPKTTLVTCHYCGHKKESIGRSVTPPVITHKKDVEAPNIVVQPIEAIKLEIMEVGSVQSEHEPDNSGRRKRNSSRFDLLGSKPMNRHFTCRWL